MTNTEKFGNVECFMAIDYTEEKTFAGEAEQSLHEAVLGFIAAILAFFAKPSVKLARVFTTFAGLCIFTFLFATALIGGTITFLTGIFIALGIALFGVVGFCGTF